MEHMSRFILFNLQYVWDSSVDSLDSFTLGMPVGQTEPKRSCIFLLKSRKKFLFFHISVVMSIQDQWFNLQFLVGWVQVQYWRTTRCNSSNWKRSNTQTPTAVSVATAASRECCGSSLYFQEQNDMPSFGYLFLLSFDNTMSWPCCKCLWIMLPHWIFPKFSSGFLCNKSSTVVLTCKATSKMSLHSGKCKIFLTDWGKYFEVTS